jgi:hypothetical protein
MRDNHIYRIRLGADQKSSTWTIELAFFAFQAGGIRHFCHFAAYEMHTFMNDALVNSYAFAGVRMSM